MTRHAASEQAAKKAAEFLRRGLPLDPHEGAVGLVLGTGWGDVLKFEERRHDISFSEIPGFEALQALKGHARQVVCGRLAGRLVVALRGRIHLNEHPTDPAVPEMVRLQIEMLIQLGVKRFILTCAAGSLKREIEVGSVVFVDGFVTCFAPRRPLYAGEFCAPEDAIDQTDYPQMLKESPLEMWRGGHAMVPGPDFEGRKYDKPFLAMTGASVVGMSVLPEASVAALYPDVKIVPIAFITNTAYEEHSHEENLRRAKASSLHLGNLLTDLVLHIEPR